MNSIHKQRVFLSILFFITGFSFATWASRIPTIKSNFSFNDAQLGTILLFMPVSSLIGLPLSGWLVSKFDSRIPLAGSFILNALALLFIGVAGSAFTLVLSICLFAFSNRILNISLNTQAINLQKKTEVKINGSFHGLWSTGGIAGVVYSTLFVSRNLSITLHFSTVVAIALVSIAYAYRFLLRDDRVVAGNKITLGKPDPFILYLGILIFCVCICEGGMFDWSGIFFKEVVKEKVFTLGYLTFMTCMSLSRFASDKLIKKLGMPRMYICSTIFIVSGISLATILPAFWTALAGFCLVGFGTAPVIPMTYALAGTSAKYSAGIAISILATYGIAGMFIGPPLIGYLSQLFGLRVAFIAFGFAGLTLVPISIRFFNYQKAKELKTALVEN